jgi:hypothetical protein
VLLPVGSYHLMWSRPPHVLQLGQGRARAGLFRVTLCRGAERRPGLVARRGIAEVTPAVFRLPTDFPKGCAKRSVEITAFSSFSAFGRDTAAMTDTEDGLRCRPAG